ncbi:MAG: SoxR reducing system RseC family protein [Bacteroidales bacterium]|nr:SoxR reducing system RseC family protein [Bacteroidales bacterium]MBN2750816.1 SoxR reducing system RseC family protein [Bacteroidales bacterium]
MSSTPNTIDHFGRVDEITLSDVRVSIISQSACASCHAKGACGMGEATEKTIVITKPNHNFIVGEQVKVVMKRSLGFKALFLGYILPFIVVVLSLIILTALGISEAVVGGISLGVLVPYYAIMYYFRNKVAQSFNFDLEKLQ